MCVCACGVLVAGAGGDFAGKNLSVKLASSFDDSEGFAFIITDQAEGNGGREIFCRIDCSAKGTELERAVAQQQRAHWVHLLQNDKSLQVSAASAGAADPILEASDKALANFSSKHKLLLDLGKDAFFEHAWKVKCMDTILRDGRVYVTLETIAGQTPALTAQEKGKRFDLPVSRGKDLRDTNLRRAIELCMPGVHTMQGLLAYCDALAPDHHPHFHHHGTKEEELRALRLREAWDGGSDVLTTSHHHHHDHHHHHHHANTAEKQEGSQRAKIGQLQRVPSVLDTDISRILDPGMSCASLLPPHQSLGKSTTSRRTHNLCDRYGAERGGVNEAWERNRADTRQSHREAELGYADSAHISALDAGRRRRERRGGERDAKRVGGEGELSSFAGSLQLSERSSARVSAETSRSQCTVEGTTLCEKGSANLRPEDRGGEQGRRTRRSEQPSSRTTSGPQAAARRPAEHTTIATENGGRGSSSTNGRVGQRESNTVMGHSAASSLPQNSRRGMRETDVSEFAQLESRARHRASDARRARPAGATEARDYGVSYSAVGELVFEKPPRRGPSSRRRDDSVARTEETMLAI